MSYTRTLAQLRASVQTRWQLENSPDLGSTANPLGIVALNEMINDALVELHDILIGKWADYKTQGPIQFVTVPTQDVYSLDTIISTGPVGVNAFYKLRKLELSVGTRWRRLYPADLEASHRFTSTDIFTRRYRYRMQLAPSDVLSLVLMPAPSSVETLRLWYVQQATQLANDSDVATFQVPIEQKLLLAIVGRDVLDRQELDPSPAIARIATLTKQLDAAADGLDVAEPFMLSPLGPGFRFGDDDDCDGEWGY